MDRSKFHILEDGCQAFGVTLTEKQIEQFEKYYELLVEWNKVMNLTGITEFDEVMQKHFVDSVAAAEYVEMEKINSLIDVGTGAGFPGIPLKIVYPHLQVTLLDSLNKRIKFLDEVVDNLGLTGIETVHGRAEDAAKKAEYREQFELSVSRAVANLASLTEYCLPFVKVGGKFVSYKSVSVDDLLPVPAAPGLSDCQSADTFCGAYPREYSCRSILCVWRWWSRTSAHRRDTSWERAPRTILHTGQNETFPQMLHSRIQARRYWDDRRTPSPSRYLIPP